MIEDIKIPEISENVESGTVVNVLVAVGDQVQSDTTIIEFETDKAVVEIPTIHAGRITEILVQEGDEKRVGDVIARIDVEASSDVDRTKNRKAQTEPPSEGAAFPERFEKPPRGPYKRKTEDTTGSASSEKMGEPEQTAVVQLQQPQPQDAADADDGRDRESGFAPAGPSVRRLARELGVDIHRKKGSGPGGRITMDDVKAAVRKEMTEPAIADRDLPLTASEPQLPDFSRWGEIEIKPLETVRRITAESTATAWQRVVRVTQFDEADITDLQLFMAGHAQAVKAAGGKLTVTAVLMKVCAEALKRFSAFNTSIDVANNQIIYKHYIHIGLMVDTPRGLLVPVVRDADKKSLIGLAVEIADLASRSRNKKITPDEMSGGTFSISNQGGIGGTGFTPVVLWPQAAILGVSRARVEPRYIDDDFRPRTILPLSLSYDHRIVDGADAARFMRWICEAIERPLTMYL